MKKLLDEAQFAERIGNGGFIEGTRARDGERIGGFDDGGDGFFQGRVGALGFSTSRGGGSASAAAGATALILTGIGASTIRSARIAAIVRFSHEMASFEMGAGRGLAEWL